MQMCANPIASDKRLESKEIDLSFASNREVKAESPIARQV
jgi:hypothetical protein